jgi:hypothetical protein
MKHIAMRSPVHSDAAQRRIRHMLLLLIAFVWIMLIIGMYYTQIWIAIGGGWQRPRFHGDPTLPFLGEALRRTAVATGSAAILATSALLLGGWLSRRFGWSFNDRAEGIAVAAALGIGSFAYIGLALASVGLYQPWALHTAVIGAIGVGGWSWLRRSRPSVPIQNPIRHGRRTLIWQLCALAAIGSAFLAALAPESEYDAVWYHLAYPQRFLQAGTLIDDPTDYVSLYPWTWELWFGYGLAWGGPIAAKLLHFICLPLTALVTWSITRRFVPGASAWLAVALFATVPTVIWEASTAYIDLALALHVALLIYALLRYVEAEQRQWLWIAAFNGGMALATKHLALVVVGLACVGLALHGWRRQRRVWPALRPAIVLGSLSLLLPLPWYLRSYLASGNPVFPELYALFGAPPERWDAVTAAGLQRFLDRFGLPRTPLNQVLLPWHVTMNADRYGGSLGPLFLLLLPLLALRRMRGAVPSLIAFVIVFVAVWASPLASFQLRFLVPITPLLAVLGAAAWARLAAIARSVAGRLGVRALTGGTALLLILHLPFFTALHERNRAGDQGWLVSVLHGLPLGVVLGGETEERYLSRTIRSYRAWQAINATTATDARVLTWGGGDDLYSERDRVWANATAMRPIAWAEAGHTDRVLRELRAHGITHLLVDRRPPPSPDAWRNYAVTEPATIARWYDEVYADQHYVVFALRKESRP